MMPAAAGGRGVAMRQQQAISTAHTDPTVCGTVEAGIIMRLSTPVNGPDRYCRPRSTCMAVKQPQPADG
jgi:hypothetical protein